MQKSTYKKPTVDKRWMKRILLKFYSRKQKNDKTLDWWGAGAQPLSCSAGGDINWSSLFRVRKDGRNERFKQVYLWPSNPTSCNFPQDSNCQSIRWSKDKDFISAVFAIVKNGRFPKYSSTELNRWLKNYGASMWMIYKRWCKSLFDDMEMCLWHV